MFAWNASCCSRPFQTPFSPEMTLMPQVLAVLQQTDSFSELWPRLATAADAELRSGGTLEELGDFSEISALVVAAGGVADRLVPHIKEVQEQIPSTVAVVAETEDYRVVAQLLGAGADAYFALPQDLGLLRTWVVERIEEGVQRAQSDLLREEEQRSFDFSHIIGRSPPLVEALERARRVISSGNVTVLLTGETGTGKDLLAQAIHHNGPRASHPFVEINCAAIPAPLLESELFGHEKGAFTGADAPKQGLFEVAHGGTLFLDEIAEVPLELQPKLLRVLDKKRVRRVGATKEVAIDVRLIAATHVDLASRQQEGRFREDLYYRLAVVTIHQPPLRQRSGDVILLAEHFLKHFAGRTDLLPPAVTPEVRRALLTYSWPGNIRELRNAVERAVVFGEWDIPKDDSPHQTMSPGRLPFPAPMENIERAAAHAMVEHFGGNKSRAAEALQISRKWLYALLSSEDRDGE
jgi:two-component system, NtrC family, response regulator HydG